MDNPVQTPVGSPVAEKSSKFCTSSADSRQEIRKVSTSKISTDHVVDYKIGISSMSLGRAWHHDMQTKITACWKAGFEGIEIFYEDLMYIAKAMIGGVNDDNLRTAAHQIRKMCDMDVLDGSSQFTIICLQPFMHYEGLIDRKEHDRRIVEMELWFELADIMETDLILIPSSFLTEGITGDFDVIVADMQKIADMGLSVNPTRPKRFAHESLCWGRFADTWEASWEIVKAVDRPNFGLCLDTFNIAGREWADPTSPDGKVKNADANFAASMAKLVKVVDVKKVFFIQVVDAERLRNPIQEDHVFHVKGQPPRMSWSRNCRLFPFEQPGYLPIMDVLHAITDADKLNYKGWVSFELFSRTMADSSANVPTKHAERGMVAWRKLVNYMKWRPYVSFDCVDAERVAKNINIDDFYPTYRAPDVLSAAPETNCIKMLFRLPLMWLFQVLNKSAAKKAASKVFVK